jgi:hypothetical protein
LLSYSGFLKAPNAEIIPAAPCATDMSERTINIPHDLENSLRCCQHKFNYSKTANLDPPCEKVLQGLEKSQFTVGVNRINRIVAPGQVAMHLQERLRMSY